MSDFLLSADQFREQSHESWNGGMMSIPGPGFGGMGGMPLPGPGDAVRRIDSRTALHGAVGIALGSSDAEVTKRVEKQVDETELAIDLDHLRRVMDMAEESALGGIPLFRPKGAVSDTLPLYDFTDAGNLADLRARSGLNLPERFAARLSDQDAKLLLEAMASDPRIEIQSDIAVARRGVLALFGANVEETVRLLMAAPTPPLGPNMVRFTLQTNTSDIVVGWWPHASKTTPTPMPNKTDAQGNTTGNLRGGYYGFSDMTNDIDDEGSHPCWPHNTSSPTVKF